MNNCRLLENRHPAPVDGPGGLFHSLAFHQLHSQGDGRFFEWADGEQVLASVHFTPTQDGCWRSPARGTFAGYAVTPGLALESLAAFHDAVEQRLVALGARRIEILPAPMAHDPAAFSNQVYLLRARGFTINRCDLNQSLDVDDRPLAQRMSYGNRKRLGKCEREGLHCEVVGIDTLPEVYDTIACNRSARGHTMSMTLAQLQTMAEALPERLVLFACRDATQTVAAAVCLRLDAQTLYVFYWGDRPGHATLSPVVSVADTIYSYCQAAGVRRLDVGTSTVDAEPNHGLLQFKRGLGFTESLKLSLEKTL
ncbi:MAG: GNAT family N-acetyltransferase [Burkholderiales bacterium]